MDTLTKEQRSYCMSQIRRRDTTPEILFRKGLWRGGYRGYRIDVKLPGKPDIYFPRRRVAIFVDGCFWHKCPKCFIRPKSNLGYWIPKIKNNILRDQRNNKALRSKKITVVRFWGHEIKENPEKCYNKFKRIYEERNHI